jgi:adenylate cyclase
MEQSGVERRLTVILAADVVGYSRLMAADEAGTHAHLKALRRELIDPRVAAHQGRIVKLMGDGALVEFASVVDAVQCAVEIQRAVAEREAGVADERRIRFRIGVNLGDVIIEDDDIYGDGVNVAARLEGLAEPGGIVISGTVFDHARNKAQAGFRFLGRQQIKNIPEPVRAYRVLLDPEAVGTVLDDEAPAAASRWRWPAVAAAAVAVIAVVSGLAGWVWQSNRPTSAVGLPNADELSIAVLPFRQPEWIGRARVFQRWDQRGHHHRPFQDLRPARDRPQLELQVQGPIGRPPAGRGRPWRPLCAGRERAQSR